jgi:hypothetical protein
LSPFRISNKFCCNLLDFEPFDLTSVTLGVLLPLSSLVAAAGAGEPFLNGRLGLPIDLLELEGVAFFETGDGLAVVLLVLEGVETGFPER